MNRKYNTLTLKEKINLIKAHETEGLNAKQLTVKFNCGKTQVYDILKNKARFKEQWFTNAQNSYLKRRPRATENTEINKITYEWFVSARSRNLPISGPILKTQAKLIAQQLQIENFKASNGWLESFRLRHGISFKQVCGEANDVNLETLTEWKEKLKDLIKTYETKNIANCDETCLFFRAVPTSTLTVKTEKCAGEKHSKERLTILLCGFADGKLEKPLVIGKAIKPRCFKNVPLESLPITWSSNKKAWMTAKIMEEWLKCLNRKMKSENRKILMFMDNAACHPNIKLTNIKICFFPPNSSITQPMDQGIIENLKINYRQHILQSLIANMEGYQSVNDLANKISVLDAVRWIGNAVKNISPECVKKCFINSGFLSVQKENQISLENEKSNVAELLKELKSDVAVEEYYRIDEFIRTEPEFQNLDELPLSENDECEIKEEDNEKGLGADYEESDTVTNFAAALRKVASLEDFSKKLKNDKMFNTLTQLRTIIEEASVHNKSLIQTTTSQMWNIKL